MKRFIPGAIIIVLAAFFLASYSVDRMVAADTYVVWSLTERHDGDEQVCTTTVYRYGIAAQQEKELVEAKNDCMSTASLLSNSPIDPLPFVEYGLLDENALRAVDLNGREVTEEDGYSAGGKRGVEGYFNEELGLGVYSEYIMEEHKTYVHFYGNENAPDGFVIDNANEIPMPMYLASISMSDDGSQVYLGTFTEASYRLMSSVPLFVYDVASQEISQVAYGKDLSFSGGSVIDTENKRALVQSGEWKTTEDVPLPDFYGPSTLHMIDLTIGEGYQLMVENGEEEPFSNVRFSPVDSDTISYEQLGGVNLVTFDQDGFVVTSEALSGTVVDWTEEMFVLMFDTLYFVFEPTGQNELARFSITPTPLLDGEFSTHYLGSITVN